MARTRKHVAVQTGTTIGLAPEIARRRTRLPHRPVRWCYGAPLTDDPRDFYPDPWVASAAQIAEWRRAIRAVEHRNEYRKPGTLGAVRHEPWGVGITVFRDSHAWEERWQIFR